MNHYEPTELNASQQNEINEFWDTLRILREKHEKTDSGPKFLKLMDRIDSLKFDQKKILLLELSVYTRWTDRLRRIKIRRYYTILIEILPNNPTMQLKIIRRENRPDPFQEFSCVFTDQAGREHVEGYGKERKKLVLSQDAASIFLEDAQSAGYYISKTKFLRQTA
jgi:hypothetical protein